MTDFVKHRAALKRAWADTDVIPLDEPMDFSAPTDPGYMEDTYSNVVRLVTFVLIFSICYMVFG